MKEGDLVYLKPNYGKDIIDIRAIEDEEDFIGLVIHRHQVGSNQGGSTILYDVLLTETNKVITISDMYFKIWRIE